MSPGGFFIFPKILIFWVVCGGEGGGGGKKWSKMTKNSVCHTPYLRNHKSYDSHLR